eukprot:scaffold1487_cov116-Isochrysis_galbana.AAC.14
MGEGKGSVRTAEGQRCPAMSPLIGILAFPPTPIQLRPLAGAHVRCGLLRNGQAVLHELASDAVGEGGDLRSSPDVTFQSSGGAGVTASCRSHSSGDGTRIGSAASIAEATSATDAASMLREADGLNWMEMISGIVDASSLEA